MFSPFDSAMELLGVALRPSQARGSWCPTGYFAGESYGVTLVYVVLPTTGARTPRFIKASFHSGRTVDP